MSLKKALLSLILVLMMSGPALANGPVVEPTLEPAAPGAPLGPTGKLDYSLAQPAVPVGATALTDRYGYSMDDTVAKSWLDLTASGTEVEFSDTDDDFAGPVDIGFEFGFYENTYTELFISTNGLVSFGAGNTYYDNQAMPRDTDPNNIVAPFWDDLDSLSDTISKVFYKTGTSSQGKYIAVEWYHVVRLGSQEYLTFEVVLYENGNILFQYNELNGELDQSTVGIEDEHGVDGLLYLHNAAGLNVSKALLFTRPAADWRSKVYPLYNSSFTDSRQANMQFTVRNSGNKGEDTYNLSTSAIKPGWQVAFFMANGKTRFTDTDQDGMIDTGPLASGADVPVWVRVTAPSDASVGDHLQFIVTVTSSHDLGQSAVVALQAAVPAPFAQVSLDSIVGSNLAFIWSENQLVTNMSPLQFTGSNLSVVALPDKRYIYTEEKNGKGSLGQSITNLEYTMLNRLGVVLKPATKLTDNSGAEIRTEDRFLFLNSSLDGRIGAIWVHAQSKVIDMEYKSNYNIHFSILDASGDILVNPINLTNNDLWRGSNDYDVPVFISPRITSTSDNRFILAWGDERNNPGGSSSDLFYAVYASDGSPVLPPKALTNSAPGATRYTSPTLVALTGNRVLMAYIVMDSGDPEDPGDDLLTTAFVAMNSAGGILKNHTLIPGSSGSTPDGVQFADGSVLLAWNVPGSAQVEYAVLNGTSLAVSKGPQRLSTPKGRVPSVVSVTGDGFNRAILTWGDAEQSDYLCYTLIDSQGNVNTPPMIFTTGLGDQPLINTNSYGLGNAPYEVSWQALLPLINR